ncbi:hypothetical protein C9374_003521 [Naegleria lovaniensis]|uniref:Peptidase S54 rhomboid domain-containing protein n=1 Tax=Naegleria lovaniensis TaxID=51637 RepID=A0AA88KLU5_NAELO|nr:uncharacterized protein C9374_003521 [Naegleria lovaniensis]KAG2385706.1 hypothetical protein C9374_003521 [Naegleria lovaniensis]
MLKVGFKLISNNNSFNHSLRSLFPSSRLSSRWISNASSCALSPSWTLQKKASPSLNLVLNSTGTTTSLVSESHHLVNPNHHYFSQMIDSSWNYQASNILWKIKKHLRTSVLNHHHGNEQFIQQFSFLRNTWEELRRKLSNALGVHRYQHYDYNSYYGGEGGGFRFTNIQKLIALNVAVFVLANLFLTRQDILANLGVSLDNMMHGKIHTLLTSMFTHIDLLHIFMNMYALSQLGKMMPMTRRLLWPAYIFCGLVASSVYLIDKWIGSTVLSRPHEYYTTGIGASGAIFGILAFVTQVHPFIPVGIFFLPIQFKLRNFFYGVLAIEFYRWYTHRDSSVSASGHLGGALGGYLFYLLNRKRLLF